jgi:cytosine/adenosine deaminase-related metal-dependent hydrolase
MKEHGDLMLTGGTAITVDPARRVIRDAAVVVSGDKIAFVGKADEAAARYDAQRLMDCRDKVIIPGIVNAHIHYSHHLSKGLIPDDLGGSPWSNFIHSKVSPHIRAENEVWAAQALLIELLKSGSTSFLEAGSYHPFDTIRSDIQKIGIKGMMGRRSFDLVSLGHAALKEDADDILKIHEQLLTQFEKQSLRIRPIVTIVGMGRFTDKLVLESKRMADRHGVPLKMHLANYFETLNETKERTGYRPVEHLDKLGVLDTNVVLVHMLHVSQREVNILAKRGAKVVHCPSTALKLNYGMAYARFPEMLEAGVPVAIGSDASDCSNYHDMVRIMYLAAVLFKDIRFDPELMGAERAIEMATINGAKAMGLEHEIGSLEAGKKADIVIFDTRRPEWRPLYDEVQSLVYSASGDSVETVIIDGRIVMEKRKMLTIDEDEVLRKLDEQTADMLTRIRVERHGSWKYV